MNRQTVAICSALVQLVSIAASAQAPTAAAKTTPSKKSWTPPRTADGHPDLEGIWTNATLTPLERPRELGDKKFFTESEAAVAEKQMKQARNADTRNADREADVARAYNDAGGTGAARSPRPGRLR